MNIRGIRDSGRRSVMIWLAMLAVMVGLVWFGMQGVGTASADGGVDTGAQGNEVNQQFEQDPNISNCIIFFIPC